MTNKQSINNFFDYGNNYEPIMMFSNNEQKVTGNKIYITNWINSLDISAKYLKNILLHDRN